mmetsp:Transcript_12398/g.23507  ORF Transcript_12398/g.23507 Transcript_12398/m.23507 type:complete len:234 (+) Transcript_12398:632-1333(+)
MSGSIEANVSWQRSLGCKPRLSEPCMADLDSRTTVLPGLFSVMRLMVCLRSGQLRASAFLGELLLLFGEAALISRPAAVEAHNFWVALRSVEILHTGLSMHCTRASGRRVLIPSRLRVTASSSCSRNLAYPSAAMPSHHRSASWNMASLSRSLFISCRPRESSAQSCSALPSASRYLYCRLRALFKQRLSPEYVCLDTPPKGDLGSVCHHLSRAASTCGSSRNLDRSTRASSV